MFKIRMTEGKVETRDCRYRKNKPSMTKVSKWLKTSSGGVKKGQVGDRNRIQGGILVQDWRRDLKNCVTVFKSNSLGQRGREVSNKRPQINAKKNVLKVGGD